MKVIEALSREELKDVFKIRTLVFVDEQQVPLEIEIDQYEDSSKHVLAYYQDNPVAAGRLRLINSLAKLERICVLKNYRKYGMGRLIIEKLEELARKDGIKEAKLHAQVQAIGFYKKLGYKQVSNEFMEDNILHVEMKKNL